MDGVYWTAGSLACSQAEVAANLAEFADLASLHDGWIPERFSDVVESCFCFVRIDVDLFKPTRDVLEFFYLHVVAGGLIVCDNYGFETCPRARHAMDAFFAERPEPIVHLPTGQGFVLIEPQQSAGLGKA